MDSSIVYGGSTLDEGKRVNFFFLQKRNGTEESWTGLVFVKKREEIELSAYA